MDVCLGHFEKHKNRFKFDAVDCWEDLFELFWSSFKCYLSSFQGKVNGSLQSIIDVFFLSHSVSYEDLCHILTNQIQN